MMEEPAPIRATSTIERSPAVDSLARRWRIRCDAARAATGERRPCVEAVTAQPLASSVANPWMSRLEGIDAGQGPQSISVIAP